MSTVSLCMIVKNEELILETALLSIAPIADEIIIVDTGSTDKTLEIASKFTDKIHHFDWIDDFSAARNFADSFGSMDYICRWDADWVLRDGGLEKLQALKKQNFQQADMVYLRWNLEFNDELEPIQAEPYYFFYKRNLFTWHSPIHNELRPINPDFSPIILTDETIEVDHLKDPQAKAHRYEQTELILQKALTNKDPEYPRLLFFYIQGLMFDGDYAKARPLIKELRNLTHTDNLDMLAWLVEQEVIANLRLSVLSGAIEIVGHYDELLAQVPKFVLIKADLTALYDPESAADLYQKYLKLGQNPTPGHFHPEREQVHPRLMLGKIFINLGEVELAKQMLKEVVAMTRLPETKSLAKITLTNIENKNRYENQGQKTGAKRRITGRDIDRTDS